MGTFNDPWEIPAVFHGFSGGEGHGELGFNGYSTRIQWLIMANDGLMVSNG